MKILLRQPELGEKHTYPRTTKFGVLLRAIKITVMIGMFLRSLPEVGRAQVNVAIGPVITIPPHNQTVVIGDTTTFTVIANSSSPLSYQWWFNATNVLAEATNASLTLVDLQSTNAGVYTVEISDSTGNVTNFTATLTAIKPHLVFAHYNVCFDDYGDFGADTNATIAGYEHDIQDAQAAGIDGFALDCGQWDAPGADWYYTNRVEKIYLAAERLGTGFKLFFSVDDSNTNDIVDMISSHASRPNSFRYQGKLVVSTFGGNTVNWQANVFPRLQQAGINVFFVPFYYTETGNLYDPTATSNLLTKYNYSDGLFYFAAGTAALITNCNQAYYQACTNAGKLFMAGYSPSYWGCVQNTSGRSYSETQGGEGTETEWNWIIAHQPDWVEITTWNDFNESTYLSPINNPGSYGGESPAAIPYRYCHAGYLELTKHYISWYKTGQEPQITQDALFYYYRTHSTNAVAGNDIPVTSFQGPIQDVIYTTVFLTAPAQLEIISGTNYITNSLTIGISNIRTPFATGTQHFTLRRNGLPVVASQGPNIWSQILNYDYFPATGYAYAASTDADLNNSMPPESQTVIQGDNAIFNVTATGAGPVGYQWWFNAMPLVGETNATLQVTNAQSDNVGAYAITVNNSIATVTSPFAMLTLIDTPPLIQTQPGNQTVTLGHTAVFTVTATSTSPVSYQWLFDGTNLPDDIIMTVAGNDTCGYSGNYGAATQASVANPTGVVLDASGNLFVADSYNNVIRKVTPSGNIITVAGNGCSGYSGDGGPATNASLAAPAGIAVDASGDLFIADANNQRIREVTPNGLITTVAGNGAASCAGDGGAATNATLSFPSDIAVDAFGDLFIATPRDQRIREVTTDGLITTVAGNGTAGYSGDGGNALVANLFAPANVAVDTSGDIFIADTGNSIVREVTTDGVITTVAGNDIAGYSGSSGWATNVSLAYPASVTVDASGDLFIADYWNSVVWKVSPNGLMTILAGNGGYNYSGDGSPAASATLACPIGVAEDAFGDLFIADSDNNVIREVSTNGLITTVAGNGSHSYCGDGGAATNAGLAYPSGVAVDALGNLFIADNGNNVIREVTTNGLIYTIAGNGAVGYSGDGGAATNASFSTPSSVAVDNFGNLFVADINNQCIRQVNPNGVIITVAGNGVQGYSGDNGMATSARLNYPFGVAVDACGNLLIADTDNNVIRRVATNGVIITVVGNHSYGHSGDGAAATSASLANPSNIAVDHAGNLFIADTGNNVIREVGLGGTIATLAGNGVAGYSGDASVATNASLGNPSGVAVDPYGNLFLADNANNVIREVNTGYGRQFILTLNNVTTNQAGVYSVIVTNAGGIVSSTNAVLTVQPSTNQTTSTN